MRAWGAVALAAVLAAGCGETDNDDGGSAGSGGTTTSGGSAGTTASGGSGGSGGTAGSGAAAGTTASGGSAGAGCDAACTNEGFSCCGSTCVNLKNDPKNCGKCGNACPDGNPFCDNGSCAQQPCFNAQPCAVDQPCCGDSCCGGICCAVPGPIGVEIVCADPATTGGSCPLGCLTCKCADPDTPIATPSGERRIDSLRPGELVYSVHENAIVAVPILRTNRTPVTSHRVLEITLESGVVLRVSGGHPTAEGRKLESLAPGDRLGQIKIIAVRSVPYRRPYTVDILPDSDTGAYFAAGALLGSTLTALR
jgi:hypothetical protein